MPCCLKVVFGLIFIFLVSHLISINYHNLQQRGKKQLNRIIASFSKPISFPDHFIEVGHTASNTSARETWERHTETLLSTIQCRVVHRQFTVGSANPPLVSSSKSFVLFFNHYFFEIFFCHPVLIFVSLNNNENRNKTWIDVHLLASCNIASNYNNIACDNAICIILHARKAIEGCQGSRAKLFTVSPNDSKVSWI